MMDFQIHPHFPAGLEAEWNALLDRSADHVPFLRFEYLRAWWATRGGGEWPLARLAIVSARKGGRLVGIAPLFISPDAAGELRLYLLGSVEISDYLDLIAAPEDLDEFLPGMLRYLRGAAPGWAALDLYNIVDSSPVLPALERAAASLGWGFSAEKLQHSPYIPLPGDWETYLAGIDKKQRHEIRRKMRRAEESGQVRWYFATDPQTFEADLDDFIALMRQDEEKAAFFRRSDSMEATFKSVARCAFENDCQALAFLEIDGKKAAGYFCFDYLNRVWVYNSGIDRSAMEFSPGWVLLGHLLRWSIEQGRTEFDFLRGDEEYKYRFGALDRFVMRAQVTPPGV
jgi:CelD/BcsL family acetyltransferase involved in cellulose biosynthesis